MCPVIQIIFMKDSLRLILTRTWIRTANWMVKTKDNAKLLKIYMGKFVFNFKNDTHFNIRQWKRLLCVNLQITRHKILQIDNWVKFKFSSYLPETSSDTRLKLYHEFAIELSVLYRKTLSLKLWKRFQWMKRNILVQPAFSVRMLEKSQKAFHRENCRCSAKCR